MTEASAGPRATRISRLITRRTARCAVRGPEDPAAVRELWVVLHGYGQLATAFIETLARLDDGTRLIVAPEALSRFYDTQADVSVKGHREATVGASWMTREERADEIADYVSWLQQAYEEHAHALPPGVPVTVLGFSQGATAASRWVAAGRVPAARLLCWGGAIAPELDLGVDSPLRRTRTYVVLGDRDKFITPATVAAERARLDAAGLPYEFVPFSGGHRLDDELLDRFARGDP